MQRSWEERTATAAVEESYCEVCGDGVRVSPAYQGYRVHCQNCGLLLDAVRTLKNGESYRPQLEARRVTVAQRSEYVAPVDTDKRKKHLPHIDRDDGIYTTLCGRNADRVRVVDDVDTATCERCKAGYDNTARYDEVWE